MTFQNRVKSTDWVSEHFPYRLICVCFMLWTLTHFCYLVSVMCFTVFVTLSCPHAQIEHHFSLHRAWSEHYVPPSVSTLSIVPASVCLPRCVHKQKEMVCAVVGNTGVWVFLCVCVLKAAIGADSVLKAALVLSSQRWTRERAMTVTVGGPQHTWLNFTLNGESWGRLNVLC